MTVHRLPQLRTRIRQIVWLLAGLCAAASAPGVESDATCGTPPRLAFALKDQFDVEHTAEACTGRIAVVIEADCAGSRYSPAWSAAIRSAMDETLRQETVWVGVATLRDGLSRLQDVSKCCFPRDAARRILLDWKSEFAARYALQPDGCNVLVFTPGGRLAFRSHGREVDPAAVAAIVAAVESLAPTGGDET